MSEWISVKDRLPELKNSSHNFFIDQSDNVLVWNVDHESWSITPNIWISYLYKKEEFDTEKEWSGFRDMDIGRVTHWMPLPEPPKETT